MEEGVLHLIQGPQPFGGLPLDRQRSLQVFLCFLPGGDVVEDPLREPGPALLVAVHNGLVQDPRDPAVPRDHPVLPGERIARSVVVVVGRASLLPVVGVDQRVPQLG
jgi:hypothetical protein